MRPGLRRLWRLPALSVVLLMSTALAALGHGLAKVVPGAGRVYMRTALRAWARATVAVLGVRVRVSGRAGATRGLVVANHVSWLDIPVLASVGARGFVAKAAVRDWPLMGWLAAIGGTRFVDRSSLASQRRITREMVAALDQGEMLTVFPEGTTSAGPGIRPLKAGLIRSATETGLAVVPFALRYDAAALGRPGAPGPVPFLGDDDLLSSLWRIAGAERVQVEVVRCPPVSGASPRALAASAGEALQLALAGVGARPGSDAVAFAERAA